MHAPRPRRRAPALLAACAALLLAACSCGREPAAPPGPETDAERSLSEVRAQAAALDAAELAAVLERYKLHESEVQAEIDGLRAELTRLDPAALLGGEGAEVQARAEALDRELAGVRMRRKAYAEALEQGR